MSWFGATSYGITCVVYAAITAVLLVSQPGGRASWSLVAAAAVTAIWAGLLTFLLMSGELGAAGLLALDAVHALAWTVAAFALLAPAGAAAGRRLPASVPLALSVALLLAFWVVVAGRLNAEDPSDSAYLALLGLALSGLLGVEQVLRNATDAQRHALRLLCFGFGGIFVADLFVYSQASLLGGLVAVSWESRALVNAALGAVLLVAIKRHPAWESELFVSRHVAFYTASLLGVGLYLLTMSAVAYLIRALGGQWSFWIELPFLAAAIGMLVFLMFSTTIKARLKVFLVKHFYRNKYDYRHEWLRLTERLGSTDDWRALCTHAIEGLGAIIGTERGSLWLAYEDPGFTRVAEIGGAAAPSVERVMSDHPMVEFLDAHRWVIDSEEYAHEPERYGSAFGPPGEAQLPRGSLVVPLDCQGSLLGFVVLSKPPATRALNFEDHDILKTAGRQVAVVLAQALAQEKLAQTRQFEAMSKLSAFLMHDLKNVVAQQELVVSNAQRFRQRPEFFDDAIETVRSGAERMRRVLEQLQSAGPAKPAQRRVDVEKLVLEVKSQCAARLPVPEFELAAGPIWVSIDRDKLFAMLAHLIRNAQDATRADGWVRVHVSVEHGALLVSVSDNGCGMSPEFIRERLFKPFETTKGVKGMGIGVFQVRDTVRSMGGDVDVRSVPGEGTVFRIRIPDVAEDAPAQRVGGPAA